MARCQIVGSQDKEEAECLDLDQMRNPELHGWIKDRKDYEQPKC